VSDEIHVEPLKTYLHVFLALMVLTALTVWAAYQDLGAWNAVLALAIASAKALLVAIVFMHLRRAERLVWLFAGAAILWLLILFGLTLADVDTREIFSGWVE
jgi:cytochrome c oxidase subunit 4